MLAGNVNVDVKKKKKLFGRDDFLASISDVIKKKKKNLCYGNKVRRG